MAGFNREDWEDLDVTREELETLTQAMKKEEFRKLLAEYAEEITDPKNRKQYQDEIVQLEAERGVDCTFVNPEPGFVVKTSVDGNKKAFVNICKNRAVGRPTYRRGFQENTPGLSWSIPMCQSPKREDLDKKRNRCSVYDVVFHPDTLCLAEKNPDFKKVVIDTALSAVEDSNKVKLDKKNIKFPKLKYKGMPVATVIRKKSKKPLVLTEEEIEFQNAIKYPFKPPTEAEPVVRNFETKKEESKEKYTIPKYVIKHSSEIDMQEFTYDKNAKINAAIPKELVIEINLPLLSSTSTVALDIMEKSLHLVCEKPVKYKLDLQLPYKVNEETGSAKFDKDKRLLVVKLPVMKARLSFKDLMREDSGVESDSSPVGSVSNNEFDGVEEKSVAVILDVLPAKGDEGVPAKEDKLNCDESERESRTGNDEAKFLDSDKQYLLPAFSCNIDDDKICFVLNVKNVDADSLVKTSLNSNSCYLKFFSIGSGFFPVYYAFLIDFKNECNIEEVTCDVWDNNVTVLVELSRSDQAISKYYVGLTEDSLTEHSLDQPLVLKKIMEEINLKAEEEDEGESKLNVNVESANLDEVVISVIPEEPEEFEADGKNTEVLAPSAPNAVNDCSADSKYRTFSESSADELSVCPLVRKSILKKRIHRSLSESNADDYALSLSVEKTVSDGSDLCINDEQGAVPHIKKTVRFNDHIRQQLFRVNSSILGQRKKNKKKSRNKRRALARRLSESENSEIEDKEERGASRKSKARTKTSLIEVLTNKGEKEKENVSESLKDENEKKVEESANAEEGKPKYGLRKDDRIFEFKSDLIFDLDM